MTHEEKAQRIVGQMRYIAHPEKLVAEIASEIRVAVKAEREECENIAKDWETLSAVEWERYYGKDVTVADAIRKRGEGE